MSSSTVDRDRIKAELVNALRRKPETQVAEVESAVTDAIGRKLNHQESQALLELIHEFIVSNILMPAMDKNNTGWPWLGVTRHGREVLDAEGPPVYDYNGFLEDLRSRVPNIDSVAERYIGESLQAFQRNLFNASIAMLGCASERIIRLLIDAYIAAIPDEKNRKRLQSRVGNRDISTAYGKFKESFDSTKSSIPEGVLVRDFDAHVDSVFTFARLLRNSIVHPTRVPEITSALAIANLQQFTYYVECVFSLISYYEDNEVTV